MSNKKNKKVLVEDKKFEFDKFMDEIISKENTKNILNENLEEVEDTPQMKYKKRYSDLPQNKTRIL